MAAPSISASTRVYLHNQLNLSTRVEPFYKSWTLPPKVNPTTKAEPFYKSWTLLQKLNTSTKVESFEKYKNMIQQIVELLVRNKNGSILFQELDENLDRKFYENLIQPFCQRSGSKRNKHLVWKINENLVQQLVKHLFQKWHESGSKNCQDLVQKLAGILRSNVGRNGPGTVPTGCEAVKSK